MDQHPVESATAFLVHAWLVQVAPKAAKHLKRVKFVPLAQPFDELVSLSLPDLVAAHLRRLNKQKAAPFEYQPVKAADGRSILPIAPKSNAVLDAAKARILARTKSKQTRTVKAARSHQFTEDEESNEEFHIADQMAGAFKSPAIVEVTSEESSVDEPATKAKTSSSAVAAATLVAVKAGAKRKASASNSADETEQSTNETPAIKTTAVVPPSGKKAKAAPPAASPQNSSEAQHVLAKAVPTPSKSEDDSSSPEQGGPATSNPRLETQRSTAAELNDRPVARTIRTSAVPSLISKKAKRGQAYADGDKSQKTNTPFRRVRAEDYSFGDHRLADNSFNFGENDYGARAAKDLSVTHGKGFTKEKNKRKKGAYKARVYNRLF